MQAFKKWSAMHFFIFYWMNSNLSSNKILIQAITTDSQYKVPRPSLISDIACSVPKALRYGRWELIASTTSATAIIFASKKISSSKSPIG